MVTEEYKNDLEEHRENVVRTLRGFVDTEKLELGYKKDVSVKNGQTKTKPGQAGANLP